MVDKNIAARVAPFRVEIAEAELDDLNRRLRATRWAGDFGNNDGRFGLQQEWLAEMVDYWANAFDWRAQEDAINRFPHFLVEIEGITIHFVHIRSERVNAVPLICTHGWPWTFWDWNETIDSLVNPPDGEVAFDVVVMSLPGYGFSSPLSTSGVDARRVAHLWDMLMTEVLGYERYAAAGGDWGAIVTGELAHVYPDHVLACWLSLPVIPGVWNKWPPETDATEFADDEHYLAERDADVLSKVTSHVAVHSHEPQTLSYALADSPAGLGAWIWSRRRDWTNSGGDATTVWDRDFLCTTAAIYWFTRTIGTSIRIYFEGLNHTAPLLHDRDRVIDVPTGIGVFPYDVFHLPRSYVETKVNLVHWGVHRHGGHFAMSEVPDLVVADIRATAVKALGDAR